MEIPGEESGTLSPNWIDALAMWDLGFTDPILLGLLRERDPSVVPADATADYVGTPSAAQVEQAVAKYEEIAGHLNQIRYLDRDNWTGYVAWGLGRSRVWKAVLGRTPPAPPLPVPWDQVEDLALGEHAFLDRAAAVRYCQPIADWAAEQHIDQVRWASKKSGAKVGTPAVFADFVADDLCEVVPGLHDKYRTDPERRQLTIEQLTAQYVYLLVSEMAEWQIRGLFGVKWKPFSDLSAKARIDLETRLVATAGIDMARRDGAL